MDRLRDFLSLVDCHPVTFELPKKLLLALYRDSAVRILPPALSISSLKSSEILQQRGDVVKRVLCFHAPDGETYGKPMGGEKGTGYFSPSTIVSS